MDEDADEKFTVQEFNRFLRIMDTGTQDVDPDTCSAWLIARPDGIWAPVSFTGYVTTQHSLLMVFYGLGTRGDVSAWWARSGFMILVALFSLAANMMSTVSLFEDSLGLQVFFITAIDTLTVGSLRTAFVEANNNERGGCVHNCMLGLLIFLVMLAFAGIAYAAAVATDALEDQFMAAWFSTWITGRLSEFFKLGFQWGCRRDCGGYDGKC